MISIPATNSNDFYWNRKYVAFTNHAKEELENYNINPINLMDMLHDSFPCKKKERHRKNEKEVCANKNRICYRIILFDDFCLNVQEECWVVKHVKPAS